MSVQEREVEELLSDLVRIDSVTPWLIPDGAGEADVARFIADWLAPTGVEVTLEEVEPGRPNVLARLPGSGGGQSLLPERPRGHRRLPQLGRPGAPTRAPGTA